jgi:hypothetical protein
MFVLALRQWQFLQTGLIERMPDPRVTHNQERETHAAIRIERMPDPRVTPTWKLHPPVEIPGEPLSEVIIRMRDPNFSSGETNQVYDDKQRTDVPSPGEFATRELG